MVEIARSRHVDASVQELWTILSDFGDISRWAPNVDHSCLMADQSDGVGTTRRIQAGRIAVVELVSSWEPGVQLAYTIEGLPPIVRSLTNTWRLDDHGDHTDVVLTATLDTGPRPPQQLIARGIGRRLASTNEEMLDGLIAEIARQNNANEGAT